MGLEGASLGLYAVFSLPRMLLYDSDDYQREMEKKTGNLEDQANALERAAKKLERRVNMLEDIHLKMKKEISVLNKLMWF